MIPQVIDSPQESAPRLSELGLERDDLVGALRLGLAAASSCTKHDPQNAAGFMQWSRTVRGLRDTLVPRGWRAVSSRNYPTVVSPDGAIAIAVAAGDHNTGIAGAIPSTRSPKGPATKDAVSLNQMSFGEVDQSFVDVAPVPRATWLLLHYHDSVANEIRFELSVPGGFDEDGVVTSWFERSILMPLTTSYQPPEEAESMPIDVPVIRR